MHAEPGTSQIKCNQLQCRRPTHAHYRGWDQQRGWRILLDILLHDPGWLWKHAFAGSERFSRLLGPEKSSKSCFFGQRLWLRAFSHQTFTMSVIIQMEFSCIEKNTVSGIRLIGQKYQAKLVLEPAKLLGAWRHCLHASADSRTRQWPFVVKS